MVLLAACVFTLAIQAKLSLYQPPHPGSVNPAAASKLWVTAERLKTAPPQFFPVLWLTTLLLFPPPAPYSFRSEPGRTPAPRPFGLHEIHCFLRPPPAFQS